MKTNLCDFFSKFFDPFINRIFISEVDFQLLFLINKFKSNNLRIRCLNFSKKITLFLNSFSSLSYFIKGI